MGLEESKSKISKTAEDYASRSTVHGISYITDRTVPVPDRCLWLLICLGMAATAVFMATTSYQAWQDDPVITTLKTVAKPVAELGFPAVTICAAGQHMDTVERVLFHNFRKWNNDQPVNGSIATLDDRLAVYFKETFQITEKGPGILDILSMMISPSAEASDANSTREH